MPELPPGSPWGPFRIDTVLGRGPSGVVYRALRIADAKNVSLKIFNEDVDEPTLRRIEEDTRRLIGLAHPNLLRVDSVAREGPRLFIASDVFDGRSLRGIASRPRREGADLLLRSARALGAAWMRLILHRNLKPENILVSVSGDVRVTDSGQFRDPTPYWSPERKANQSPDLRGDLFSLGTIFKEWLPAGDPDLDALLHQMTRVETFERVQMVEDVLSRLEAWMARQPATVPASPPPPYLPPAAASMPAPPPSFPDPGILAAPRALSVPTFPAAPDWDLPDPALDRARASIVQTLSAITGRTTSVPTPPPPPPANRDLPEPRTATPARPESRRDRNPEEAPLPLPPPPTPRPVVVDEGPLPPPPLPRAFPSRRRGGFWKLFFVLFWMGPIVGVLAIRQVQRTLKSRELDAVRQLQEEGRIAEAKRTLEIRVRADQASADEKKLLERIQQDEWSQTLATIRRLEAQRRYSEALNECDRYLKTAGPSPPLEAVELKKSLKAWTSAVSKAELYRRTGADKLAAEVLSKSGEARKSDVDALLSAWCDEDWTKAKTALDAAVTQNDPYSAIAELDRFLKKPHQGGAHRKDAETRRLSFQADVDYAELADRMDTLQARAPREAAALLESFLAKPHAGGTHREEALQHLGRLQEDVKGILYSGRVSIARLAASPEGTRIAFPSDGVKVLDAASREELWSVPVRTLLRSLAFGSDDRLVTATSSKVQAWDLRERKELRSFTPSTSYLVALAIKPDGKTVVGALSDGTLFTWDSGADDPAILEREAAPGVVALALSAGGSRLALAARDKSLRVRELPGGKEWKWAGPPVTVSALALSPDGRRVLTGSANGTVTLWTAETGEAGSGVGGHTGSVTCAAFSPDGGLLATGGADAQIRIASSADGTPVKTLTGHHGRISSIAFVRGGLVSSSADGSVRFWSLP